ncbi:MAG: molybdate ABC transporter substrate-binding protein [Pleurocapsa sp.]
MTSKIKITSFLTITVLSSLLVIGSNTIGKIKLEQPSNANQSTQLILSAAASLKSVIEDIEPLYQQKHPETEIIYNFGSSGSLQRQIEQGAPVDVFISAASKQMDALEKEDMLLTETRRDLLKNQMVLITSESNAKNNPKFNSFEDLTHKKLKTIALGEPESVPAGNYAQEVLTSFQIADKVIPKAVYGKDVRQVLNYVATGNAEAGIVYRTDVQIINNVEIVATAPEDTHSPVVYPIAVIKNSQHREEAKDLIEFLTTPEAKKVFEENGFVTVNGH